MTIAIVPGERHAQDESADTDDHGVERGDERDPEEVASHCGLDVVGDQRRELDRKAQVAVDPALDRRAVLQQEEDAEAGEREEEDERGEGADTAREPVQHRVTRSGDGVLDVALCRGGVVGTGVVEPLLDRVDGVGERGLDLRRLIADPGDHEHHDHDDERDQAEKHDCSARCARHVMSFEPGDEWRGDDGDDRAEGDGLHDRGGDAQDPDKADQQGKQADKEPRHEAEIA